MWIGEWGEEDKDEEDEDKDEDKGEDEVEDEDEEKEGRDERSSEWLEEQAKASRLVRSIRSLQGGMSTSNEEAGFVKCNFFCFWCRFVTTHTAGKKKSAAFLARIRLSLVKWYTRTNMFPRTHQVNPLLYSLGRKLPPSCRQHYYGWNDL